MWTYAVSCIATNPADLREVAPAVPDASSPVAAATRVSLALRGVRPAVVDLEAVEAGVPVEDLARAWIEDDGFYANLRDMHADWLEVRSDLPVVWPSVGPLEGVEMGSVHASLSEAPLVRIEEIARAHRPYTDVLVGGDPWVDTIGAAAEGLPYDPDGPEWQESSWVDGRPDAGLLSETRLWTRHNTNLSGKHRVRANVVARTFLCDDIGARAIDVFDVSLLEPNTEADAVSTTTTCLGCHGVLEPLASSFWGWRFGLTGNSIDAAYDAGCTGVNEPACYPARLYDPGTEDQWQDHGLLAPAYYGTPLEPSAGIGALVASDARMPICVARRVAAWFRGVALAGVDDEEAEALGARFADSGFDLHELVLSVVLDDDFLGTGIEPLAPAPLRPEAMARQVAAATGLAWEADTDTENGLSWGIPVPLLGSDRTGYRALAGGSDGDVVNVADLTMSPTRVLVYDALAMAAAEQVVRTDFDVAAGDRRLLALVEPDDFDDALVRTQLVSILWTLTGARHAEEDVEVAELANLFEVGRVDEGEPAGGWRLVLRVLFADPSWWMAG
jgi:hypothetical protein